MFTSHLKRFTSLKLTNNKIYFYIIWENFKQIFFFIWIFFFLENLNWLTMPLHNIRLLLLINDQSIRIHFCPRHYIYLTIDDNQNNVNWQTNSLIIYRTKTKQNKTWQKRRIVKIAKLCKVILKTNCDSILFKNSHNNFLFFSVLDNHE